MAGACTAAICHLLCYPTPANPNRNPSSEPPQNPNLRKIQIKLQANNINGGRQRRQLLLLCLPIWVTNSSGSCIGGAWGLELVSPAERDASALVSRRVGEAVELLERGRDLQAQGDFIHALYYFTQVIENYKDFALSDYARVGRAIALYEVGDREEAIAEMEDVSISLKGYPEVHAALAAALYVDKHAPLLAENQFTIATLLDPHYTDISYVRETKHWPPSLISSLQHFIALS
ncbi:uncharacterized protein LOC130786026 [Actinidia eriantha]|uniref:uncharacterized protein LOC130786026 n=1 Tax=Actinidia eriantha TaxID=165200 RepID=UPI0025865DE9|nr:uncharacterized protein LOC130786026 [Actinidia eriantha]